MQVPGGGSITLHTTYGTEITLFQLTVQFQVMVWVVLLTLREEVKVLPLKCLAISR